MRSATVAPAPSTKRRSRSVSRPSSRAAGVDDDQRADARPRHQRHAPPTAARPGRCCRDRAMTPCCVRLTFSTSRTCGSISPGRKPRSMMPMPPSSACTIAIGARVTVSMLADTIGRLQRDAAGTAGTTGRSTSGSRRASTLYCGAQDEVVEGAAAHELDVPARRSRVDGRESSHGSYYRGFARVRESRVAGLDGTTAFRLKPEATNLIVASGFSRKAA